jgi:hypothetical protein
MVSRCCRREVFVVNSEYSYYVCDNCFKACELRETHEQPPMGNDHKIIQRYNAANERTRRMACLQNKRIAFTRESSRLVCSGFRTFMEG